VWIDRVRGLSGAPRALAEAVKVTARAQLKATVAT
jgi:hypothetical protein